jgi:hypothetical protein
MVVVGWVPVSVENSIPMRTALDLAVVEPQGMSLKRDLAGYVSAPKSTETVVRDGLDVLRQNVAIC